MTSPSVIYLFGPARLHEKFFWNTHLVRLRQRSQHGSNPSWISLIRRADRFRWSCVTRKLNISRVILTQPLGQGNASRASHRPQATPRFTGTIILPSFPDLFFGLGLCLYSHRAKHNPGPRFFLTPKIRYQIIST